MKTPINYLQEYFKGSQHPINVVLSLYVELQSNQLIEEANSQCQIFDKAFDHSNLLHTFPQILSNSNSIELLLDNIHFSNKLNFNILNKINNTFFDFDVSSIECIVYSNILSFVYKTAPTEIEYIKSQDFLIILECLFKLSKHLHSESNNKININSYFFHTLLACIFTKNTNQELQYCNLISTNTLTSIEEYVNLNFNFLSESFSNIYLIIIKEIMKQENLKLKETLNKNISDQLKCKGKIPLDINQHKLELINLIKPMILEFYEHSINILIYLSKNNQDDQFSLYLEYLYESELPNSLLQKILSEKKENIPHFEEKEFDYQKKLDSIESKLADNKRNYKFINKTYQSFPKGIEMLPSAFSKDYEDENRSGVSHPIDIFQTEPNKTNLINCINLICASYQKFAFKFLKTFSELLKKNRESEYFQLIYAAYLTLLGQIVMISNNSSEAYSKFLDESMELLDIPFDQKHLIFIDGYLSPLNNLFRNEIFELLFTDIQRFLTILHTKRPFLYAEHLGRILSTKLKHQKVFQKLAENETFCEDVIKVARILQLIDLDDHSELISKMRNTVFLFTFELVKYRKFESQKFGPYFFVFLFESEITDSIIQIIENYYIQQTDFQIDPVIGQISKALKICAKEVNSKTLSDYELYSNLAFKLSQMIANVMHQNLHSVNLFYTLFDVICKNFIVRPTTDLLIVILQIILFISLVKPNFLPKSIYLIEMSNYIKQFQLKQILIRIYCILKGTTQFSLETNNIKTAQLFLIKQPQFLPFLLSSFGTSIYFGEILKNLMDLCHYSLANLVAMHEGYIDIILLKFLQQNKEKAVIEYCGLNIELCLNYEDQKSKILPMLMRISSYISSFEVASQYLLNLNGTFTSSLNLFYQSNLSLDNSIDDSNSLASIKSNPNEFSLNSNQSNSGQETTESNSSLILNQDELHSNQNQITPSKNDNQITSTEINFNSTESNSLSSNQINLALSVNQQNNFSLNLNAFSNSLHLCKKQYKPNSILLTRLPTNSIATGLNSEFSKKSFTIVFWLRLDTNALARDNARIDLINIKDNKKTLFIVYALRSKLYLQYDHLNIRTVVKLADWPSFQVKNKKSGVNWHFVSITYSIHKNHFNTKTSIDNDEPIKSEMTKIEFQSEELTIIFNKAQSKSYEKDEIYGYLSEFKIFDRILNKDEKHQLFLSNYTKNDYIQFKMNIENNSMICNLADQFQNEDLLAQFLKALQANKSFEFFNTSKAIFESIDQKILLRMAFLNNLKHILVQFLNSFTFETNKSFNLYLIAYSIFNCITEIELKDNWLKEILLNISIWSKIENGKINNQFIFIINHWISPLFTNNIELFTKFLNSTDFQSTFFSKLLKSFGEFCSEPEIRTKLIQFISMIGSIQKSITFSRDLFLCLLKLPPENILTYYLDISVNISPYIHKNIISQFNAMVGIFFKQYLSNLDILIKLIKISYQLANSWTSDADYQNSKDRLNYTLFNQVIQFLFILEQKDENLTVTKKLFYSIINCEVDHSEFDLSNSILNAFPNLFTLMIALSLKLTKQEIHLATQILLEMKLKNMKIENTPYWFIFPILLLFKIGQNDEMILLDFLGSYGQIHSQIEEISNLLILFESILRSNSMNAKNSLNYKFLTALNNNTEIDLDTLIKLDVNATIWHLSITYPFKLLEEEFKKSQFNAYDISKTIDNVDLIEKEEIESESYDLCLKGNSFEYCPKIYKFNEGSLNRLNDLLSLLEFAINLKYRFLFRIEILHIMNHNLLETASKIISKHKQNCEFSKLVDYFIERIECYFNSKEFDKRMDTSLNDFIYNQGLKYSDEFNSEISSLLSSLLKTFQLSIKLINGILIEEPKSTNNSQIEVKPKKVQRKQIEQKKIELTMSNYFTRGCQFKLADLNSKKSGSEAKKEFQSHFFNRNKSNSPAVLVNLNSEKKVHLKVIKNSLIVTNENDSIEFEIDLNQISTIFQYSTGLELFIKDNSSYKFTLPSTNSIKSILSVLPNKDKAFSKEILNPFDDLIQTNSTFDYLIRLNYLNGRSFHSISNYPIFPQFFDNFNDLQLKSTQQKKSEFKFLNEQNSIQTVKVSSIQNYNCVPPQFYYLPEIIDLDTDISWAKNSIQFTHKLLNFLETDIAKQFILNWAQKVFDKPLLVKNSFKINSNFLNVIYQINNSKTIFYGVSQFKYFIEIDSNGIIKFYKMNSFNSKEDFDKKKKTVVIQENSKLAEFSIENPQDYQFFTFSNASSQSKFQYQFRTSNGVSKFYASEKDEPILFCFNQISMTALVFDLNGQTKFHLFSNHFSEGLFTFLSNNDLIYCETKYLIKSLFTGFEFSSNYAITKLAASSEFGIVAFSNTIGYLNIVDFSSNLIKTVKILNKLNETVESISITKNFGFIVIQTSMNLIVLTLHGSIVFNLPIKVERILTFSSINGLDIISFLSEDNEVRTLYYLVDNKTQCHGFVLKIKKSETVIDIKYDEIDHSFFITTASNKVIVIPQNIIAPAELPDKMIKH